MLNRQWVFMSFGLMAFVTGCQSQPAAKVKPVEITTFEQKVSYLQGYSAVRNFKKNNIALDEQVFIAAMRDAINGVDPVFPEDQWPEIRKQIDTLVKQAKADEEKKLIESNTQKEKLFLEENKKKDGVQTTASGLQYRVLTMGTGEKPKLTDIVTLKYTGKLLDGTEFDSSIKKDKNSVSFNVNRLIPGWIEALLLMPQGSKWEIYVPAELAYGTNKHGSVPPGSTLIFEIELLNAKPSVPNPNIKSRTRH